MSASVTPAFRVPAKQPYKCCTFACLSTDFSRSTETSSHSSCIITPTPQPSVACHVHSGLFRPKRSEACHVSGFLLTPIHLAGCHVHIANPRHTRSLVRHVYGCNFVAQAGNGLPRAQLPVCLPRVRLPGLSHSEEGTQGFGDAKDRRREHGF